MTSVYEFLDELSKDIDTEDMHDDTKVYYFKKISAFREKWEQRVSPDYEAEIKSLREEMEKRESVADKNMLRLQQTIEELRYEKDETVKHYEEQLDLKSKAIDRLVESNSEMNNRIQLAEDLNFNLMESFIAYKKKKEEYL
jgi:hypothetical protein